MSDAATVVIVVFITLLIGNFVLQFYVASQLYGAAFFLKALRGTRVFIDGWKAAKERDIQDLMVLWSGIVAGMIFMLCPVAYYGSQYDPDAESTAVPNEVFRTREPTATRPFTGISFEITSPAERDVLSISANEQYVPVMGSVNYDRRQVDKWEFVISTVGGRNRATFGDIHYAPIPDSNAQLGELPLWIYEPGVYWITVRFRDNQGRNVIAVEDFEWHEIVIAE